jgi:hypothetical protein
MNEKRTVEDVADPREVALALLSQNDKIIELMEKQNKFLVSIDWKLWKATTNDES